MLIVNGSTVLHLNQPPRNMPTTWSEDAYRRDGENRRQAIWDHTAPGQRGFQDLVDQIYNLIEIPDLDPVTYLDFERYEPYSAALSALTAWTAP